MNRFRKRQTPPPVATGRAVGGAHFAPAPAAAPEARPEPSPEPAPEAAPAPAPDPWAPDAVEEVPVDEDPFVSADDPDAILDAEIVEDDDLGGADLDDSTADGFGFPSFAEQPAPAGPPLVVTVAELQSSVAGLQGALIDHLTRFAARLDALEARVAAPAPEPAWVARLEEALADRAGADQGDALSDPLDLSTDLAALRRVVAERADAAEGNAVTLAAELEALRGEVAQLGSDLRAALATTEAVAAEEPAEDAVPEILERLADIRAALRLLVG